ncbi:MAG TPA: hypothetical protein VGA70_09630 [Longimicrobiales bacterium]|jgi:hypothetical protein
MPPSHRPRPRPSASLAALALPVLLAWPADATAQDAAQGAAQAAAREAAPSTEWQIAAAVLAAPEEHRDGAEVRAWNAEGRLVTIREGTNNLICLADEPGDGRFRAACYHVSLEPFMARGRELTAAGVEGMERQETRWDEADAGLLLVPRQPAMVYNLGFDSEDFDPATVNVGSAGRLHAIYIPYATSESTGLPTNPAAGGPWLMWPGKASAHVMVAVPPSGG